MSWNDYDSENFFNQYSECDFDRNFQNDYDFDEFKNRSSDDDNSPYYYNQQQQYNYRDNENVHDNDEEYDYDNNNDNDNDDEYDNDDDDEYNNDDNQIQHQQQIRNNFQLQNQRQRQRQRPKNLQNQDKRSNSAESCTKSMKQIVKKLETLKLAAEIRQNYESKQEKGYNVVVCAICLMELQETDKIRILPCIHKYHQKCINSWIERKKQCPICRSNI